MSIAERLEQWSIPEPNSGCLLWTGWMVSKGYGGIAIDGKTRRAHRVAWEVARGQIPTGMMVLHKCDVRSCVNPEHLFLGTNGENVADMMQKGRQLRGEKNGAAKLSDADAAEIRSSKESSRALADRFGIHPTHVWAIRVGVSRRAA